MMGKKVFKKRFFSSIREVVGASAFTAAAAAMVLYGIRLAEGAALDEGRNILEEGLRRAVVTCYAVEGEYPESLSYIESNYGIAIDKTKYTVFYQAEASNVFPEITVLTAETK